MASKIFLDANVLLDLTIRRDNYEEAKGVLKLVIDNKIKAYVTPSIIHILGHYLTKSYGSTQAKEMILTLLMDINVIDVPQEIVLVALNSQITDIEDSLQYYAAIHHKINCFISSDKSLKKSAIPTLPVLTPKEFIDVFHDF